MIKHTQGNKKNRNRSSGSCFVAQSIISKMAAIPQNLKFRHSLDEIYKCDTCLYIVLGATIANSLSKKG